ncbi:metallophosphoesterase family protein [Streptococcus xiaochunlingii]|uniref:Metallophosphoesterase n=1 Tax=Streptococcus xiaochunlingii TaxID=2589788 RepID=A0ABY2YG03_9STRE|nr:metallophosphoesterase family protein [Streptococcus xiaochunlingii]MDK8386359.1 metallophosphoesterase family protein [Streptococcus xiaochunlingii]MDK8777553.1 metallophosphoesterase family protein [Streptococcus xiaochunlingii]TPE38244.1 metallophosphoesterase [Streptococcus xiaochunlingii]
MTKIALLSDIHGNTTALEAVLEDAKRAGVEEYWLLGDVLMPGTGRRHLLNLLEELPITVQILGNWEDSLWRAMKGMLDPSRASHRYLMRHCQYILEEIRPEEIEAMQSLPMQVHRKVSGLRLGITHHLPDKNWGRELIHIGDQKDFDRLVTNPPCDIAVYGHIHQQFFRYGSGGELILNPGSIGQPFFLQANLRKDLRAMYAILEFDESGLKDVDFRRVSYDIEKELQLAKDLKLPYFQVYYESLVNGVHHTHNHELLHEIAQREGHNVEVDAWLRDFFN